MQRGSLFAFHVMHGNDPAVGNAKEETMGQLDGKIGIITGAASGIGAACARVLSREGAKLVLTDLDDAAGQRLAAEVGGIYLHHDVTDEAGWPAVVAAAEQLRRTAYPGGQCRHRHHGLGDRHVAGRLAATDGGERRRRVPDGEIRRSADAPFRWRLGRDDVVGRRACAGRRTWPATARPRARCGCSPSRSRWSARRRATASG